VSGFPPASGRDANAAASGPECRRLRKPEDTGPDCGCRQGACSLDIEPTDEPLKVCVGCPGTEEPECCDYGWPRETGTPFDQNEDDSQRLSGFRGYMS